MDSISFGAISAMVKDFGVPAIVLIIWWFSDKAHQRTLTQYRDDMASMRRMYENNAELVKDYRSLAKNLQDVVIMNTQAITQVCKDVESNQFCPQVRAQQRGS